MLLAFLTDQIVQHCSQPFKVLWKACKTKLWEMIRAIFQVKNINSFQHIYRDVIGVWLNGSFVVKSSSVLLLGI
jgi:hypothetical protein